MTHDPTTVTTQHDLEPLQYTARHPDFHDLGFVCSCGARTRAQLNGWAQWDAVYGELWDEVCGSCGRRWWVELTAQPADDDPLPRSHALVRAVRASSYGPAVAPGSSNSSTSSTVADPARYDALVELVDAARRALHKGRALADRDGGELWVEFEALDEALEPFTSADDPGLDRQRAARVRFEALGDELRQLFLRNYSIRDDGAPWPNEALDALLGTDPERDR